MHGCRLHTTSAAGLDDAGRDTVRLMDDQTFETMDAFSLDPSEVGCSVCTISFADDPAEYFAVGTAYVLPEEAEPTKARPPPRHCLQIHGSVSSVSVQRCLLNQKTRIRLPAGTALQFMALPALSVSSVAC